MFIHKTRDIFNLNEFNTAAIAHNSKIVYVVKMGSDDLRFTISEALTTQEDTDLDSFISAFDDTIATDSPLKLLSIAKEEAVHKHFHNIDYKKEVIGALIPERESGTIKGEVQEVIWYKSMDGNNAPTDPVIKVNIAYTRDASGFAMYRVTNRQYYKEDETLHPEVKTTIKYYYVNKQDMIDEGIKRRGLLVKTIQIPTMNMMAEVLMPIGVSLESVVMKGRRFMDDYEVEFENFIKNSSTVTDPADDNYGRKSIIVKLEEEDDLEYVAWLDSAPNSLGGATTIRQYLMEEFNI
jgi:hypothetical protein